MKQHISKVNKILCRAKDHFYSFSEMLDGEESVIYREKFLECEAALEILEADDSVLSGELDIILSHYAASLRTLGFPCHAELITKFIQQQS